VTSPWFRRSKCDGRHNAFSALQCIEPMRGADRRADRFAGIETRSWIVLDFMRFSLGFSGFFLGDAVRDK
jgi:hypothetical protein